MGKDGEGGAPQTKIYRSTSLVLLGSVLCPTGHTEAQTATLLHDLRKLGRVWLAVLAMQLSNADRICVKPVLEP